MSITQVAAIVLGAVTAVGALVFLVRERADRDSVKIYGIAAVVGAAVALLGAFGVIA